MLALSGIGEYDSKNQNNFFAVGDLFDSENREAFLENIFDPISANLALCELLFRNRSLKSKIESVYNDSLVYSKKYKEVLFQNQILTKEIQKKYYSSKELS